MSNEQPDEIPPCYHCGSEDAAQMRGRWAKCRNCDRVYDTEMATLSALMAELRAEFAELIRMLLEPLNRLLKRTPLYTDETETNDK